MHFFRIRQMQVLYLNVIKKLYNCLSLLKVVNYDEN